MIGFIEGEVVYRADKELVVAPGGVGYTVSVLPAASFEVEPGRRVRLWTHLAVREDALQLFGFLRREELILFRMLLGVPGIGGKSAMNVLALADIETIRGSIASGDSEYLTKVSGIGKKLAQKIVLELKEKIGATGTVEEWSGIPKAEMEALDALDALGYPPRDSRTIVHALAREHSTAEEIIRGALQKLGEK